MFLSIFTFLLTLRSVTAYPTPASDDAAKSQKYTFFFGDSYTSVGFNYSGPQPSPSNPIGNPAYPGDTFSGGANYADFLTTTYNRSLLLTYDYAYGCATVDQRLVSQCDSTIKSLTDQLDEFHKTALPAFDPFNTLFTVWIGINDAHRSYTDPDIKELMGKVTTRYFELVKELYDAGARKFLFLTVPPYERTPQVLAESRREQRLEREAYEYFNGGLEWEVNHFRETHRDTTVLLLDTAPVFNAIIDNPASVGARDALCEGQTAPTPAEASRCLWWDSFHPGVAMNRAMARGFARAVAPVYGDFWTPHVVVGDDDGGYY